MNIKQKTLWLIAATLVAIMALPLSVTFAQGKGKGGGKGGRDETTAFSVIELPGLDKAFAVSNPDALGFVTVAGGTSEGGFAAAGFAYVDTVTREVVSGLLPEPTDNAPVDSASHALDANSAGVIVGGADVYDETVPGNRRSVAVRWIPSEDGYQYELLPLLDGDSRGSVDAVNEAGTMVGTSRTANSYRPALWSADGSAVIDPNELLPEGSPWILTIAMDINNNGQMAGYGMLNGVERGFVLDIATGAIDAVPLVDGATLNQAWQINDAGHVIGVADDDIVGGGPIPQGGWGFFWAGPGSEPQLLPSATGLHAIADGINNFSEISGHSDLPDTFDIQMSLWKPNADGSFTVTALETQIPAKPVWTLHFGFGINDEQWIAGDGRKFVKGKYSWHGVLVVPNP